MAAVLLVAMLSQLILTKKIWIKQDTVNKFPQSPIEIQGQNTKAKLTSDIKTVPNSGNVAPDPPAVPPAPNDAPGVPKVLEGVPGANAAVLQAANPAAEANLPLAPLSGGQASLPLINCNPGVPCEYNAEVDLRIILMVFDRSESLRKVLDSLQLLELDGDTGVIEIWIDRSAKTNSVNEKTVQVAQEFKWKHGLSRVNVQKEHVGIYGQWIDTWRPNPNSKEIALFLEDDVDLSPYAYRWLKAAFKKYRSERKIASYAIFEGAIYAMKHKLMPDGQTAFLHQRMGSQGMAPDPDHWRDFQDWFHKVRKDPSFHPYVRNDHEITAWYKGFEKKNTQGSMWSIWYIYYNDKYNLWTLYSNLGKVMNKSNSSLKEDQYLAFHRKEKGLHFHGKPISSKTRLITTWYNYFIELLPPFSSLKKISYYGKVRDSLTWNSITTRGP